MANHDKSDTFSDSDLLALIDSVQNGDRAAEGKLFEATKPLFFQVARKWKNLKRLYPEDRAQICFEHVLGILREGGQEIKNAEAWLRNAANNCLRNEYDKEKALKRHSGEDFESLDDEIISDTALGELSEDLKAPDEVFERRENNEIDKIIRQFMEQVPKNLREGIEKSLDLIVDLFRTRSNLRDKIKRDSKHSRRILKVIRPIAEARKFLGKFRYPDPENKGLLRLRELRGMPDPAFSGRPEEDKKVEDFLTEASELEKKFGAALNLYEAQLELSAEISNPEVELRLTPGYLLDPGFLVDYKSPWIDHLSEIAGMKVSPLNLIYKVWSRAPGFKKAGSGKYRNRKEIEFALYSYKKTSKGTDREFLFSSIKDDAISSLGELEKKFERFRKAGYGQALQTKYKPMIDLIYRKSFRN